MRYRGSSLDGENTEIPPDYMEPFSLKPDYMEPFSLKRANEVRAAYEEIVNNNNKYFIIRLFTWCNTREGGRFWKRVYDGDTPLTEEIKENIKIKVTTYLMGVYDGND